MVWMVGMLLSSGGDLIWITASDMDSCTTRCMVPYDAQGRGQQPTFKTYGQPEIAAGVPGAMLRRLVSERNKSSWTGISP
jgi:hypothetical protein